jgi:hypothetical protein
MLPRMDSSEIDRIVRLERQVDFLFRRLGIDPTVALDDDVLPAALYDAINRGKLVDAISIYRQVTGASLKDAKVAVEAMARQR